jgi:hypothetical protein
MQVVAFSNTRKLLFPPALRGSFFEKSRDFLAENFRFFRWRDSSFHPMFPINIGCRAGQTNLAARSK